MTNNKDFSFFERLHLKRKYGQRRAENYINKRYPPPEDAFSDYRGDAEERRLLEMRNNEEKASRKASTNNNYEFKTLDNVAIAFVIGFFGGPISAIASGLMLYILKKRETVSIWKTWFLIGIIAMPITNLMAQGMFKWDVNSFALIQSRGKYRTYLQWSKDEKEIKAQNTAASKSKKKEATQDKRKETVEDGYLDV